MIKLISFSKYVFLLQYIFLLEYKIEFFNIIFLLALVRQISINTLCSLFNNEVPHLINLEETDYTLNLRYGMETHI